MASAAAAAPPPASRSFAGLLEEYAAPPAKFPPARDPGPPQAGVRPWGEGLDGLEDDVATLSYEHALKAHARYRRQPEPGQLENSAGAFPEPDPLIPPQEPQALPRTAAVSAEAACASRKSASVTVRLSAAEAGRLRARAAEAGLTVSAYLRFCALEVESLRAQVKEAVAQMRESEPQPQTPRRWWLARLLARRHGRA